jgi:hypothetical protein
MTTDGKNGGEPVADESGHGGNLRKITNSGLSLTSWPRFSMREIRFILPSMKT